MTQTAIGILADKDGFASRQELEQGDRGPVLRMRAWSSAAGAYRREQAAVDIEAGHGGPVVGRLVDLQLDEHERLWAVATVDDRVRSAAAVWVGDELREVPVDLYWSATRSSRLDDTDLELRSVAIVTASARVGATPLKILDGSLDGWHGKWAGQVRDHELQILERARDTVAVRRRSRDARIYITDHVGYDDDGYDDNPRFMSERAARLDDRQWERAPLRHSGARGFVLNVTP